MKTKTICTVKTARIVILVTAIILAAFDSQFFFIMRVNEDDYCDYIKSVPDSYKSMLYRIDATLYSFAPFAIIGLFNLAIIYKFVKAKLANSRSGTTESTNQALSKSAMRGTAILITVSITFLLLTGPSEIVYSITTDPLPSTVTYIMKCTNHSINGVLYCIVAARFRAEVIKTLRCGRAKGGKNNIEMGSSTIFTTTTSG